MAFPHSAVCASRQMAPPAIPEPCDKPEEEEEEEEEEEGLFKANEVNEEDPERDRATQV